MKEFFGDIFQQFFICEIEPWTPFCWEHFHTYILHNEVFCTRKLTQLNELCEMVSAKEMTRFHLIRLICVLCAFERYFRLTIPFTVQPISIRYYVGRKHCVERLLDCPVQIS